MVLQWRHFGTFILRVEHDLCICAKTPVIMNEAVYSSE